MGVSVPIRDRYELRIARRDGREMRFEPRPVTEFFKLEDDREFEEVCGKHFIPLAAAAERVEVKPHQRVREFADWLGKYQLEIWHKDNPREPVAVSTSTHGWKD